MENDEKKLIKRLEKARKAGNLDDWESYCRRLAELHVSCGHYEDALRAYQEELSVCEAKNDAVGIANAHRMVGEMHSTLGQFEESLIHVNKYLDFGQKSNNSVERQRAYATLGRTYFCWAAELATDDKAKASELLSECRKAYNKSLYICMNELKNIGNKERQEMKARIMFNMGLAFELEQDLPTALNYVSKSISICKQECLWEDLYRCYISQGSMFLKQNDSAALSAIDQACDVAKKLPNATELTVLALIQKSEVYFSMGNYSGAKWTLKKAFKMKSPNEEDRKTVELSLKRSVLLVDLESKLAATDVKSLLERKNLYEKLGDACCSVKNFQHAIQCYLNMLDCALALGQSGRDLQPCYVSLYQTYRDDKQYDLALEYARKELEISCQVDSDVAKSHIAIGEILELKGASYYDISEEYMIACQLAQQSKDPALEASALRRLITVQLADGREELASETKKKLLELGRVESDDSQSEEEDSFLNGVHLSDLSDSDEETIRARPSRNTFRVTRNEKGETPLHVAAIRGDVSRAQRLLSLGHSVKERDLAGWTPLHEAANHGHIEMVRVLLKAGADVNDPGGRDCGGVTPLHDSASCGHFDVINVLLEHNASVTALTDAGETPLECLRAWRRRVDDLNSEDESKFDGIVKDLETKLTAAGFQLQSTENKKSTFKKTKRSFDNTKLKRLPSNLRRGVDLREKSKDNWSDWTSVSPVKIQNTSLPLMSDKQFDIINLENLPPESLSPSLESSSLKITTSPQRPVADYRAAIDGLRKRPLPVTHSKPRIDCALLDENSYVEEWLEDDMKVNRAQKKKRKVHDLTERSAVRNRKLEDNVNEYFFPLDYPADLPSTNEQSRKKQKLQTTLLDIGFSSEPVVSSPEIPSAPTDVSFDFPSLPSPPSSSVSDHTLTKVRVNVGRLTLLVPVDSARVDDLTVRWLADEAARRYCEMEGAEPNLQLKTRDGAMLASTDPVSVALGEDLDSNVVGWKTASLSDRYREAVAVDNCTSRYGAYVKGLDMAVMERLASCESSRCLDLSNLALTAGELKPVLRALKHERDLKVLNLAGNAFGDIGLETLVQNLEHSSVEELNLRCNNITGSGFNVFVDSLHTMSQDFLSALRSLDVSFNPLGTSTILQGKLSSTFQNLVEFKTEFCEADFLS